MATKKANISASHKAAHDSLQNSMASFHESLNELHLQQLEIQQKMAMTKLAATNELAAVKGLNITAEALAQRVVVRCW